MASPQRIAEVLMQEAAAAPTWWWLSFADATRPKGTQFLGVAIVEGRGIATAVAEAHRLGVNPGGEVQGWPVPPEHLPAPTLRNRLLSRAELEEAGL